MTKATAIRWPADKVSRWPIDDLVPYARNARTHSAEQVSQIARSIEQFGFTFPVLVAEDGTIIAGHGRVMAAKELGLAEVPVMVAEGWTEEQRRLYTLADNSIALNSAWDDELLRLELGELIEDGAEISLAGFDAAALDALFSPPVEDAKAKANATLAERFGVPPFTVMRASEGWWQNRKRGWIGLGIQSELGRGEAVSDASPGGSARPATDYSKRQRGDGTGRAV